MKGLLLLHTLKYLKLISAKVQICREWKTVVQLNKLKKYALSFLSSKDINSFRNLLSLKIDLSIIPYFKTQILDHLSL